MSVNTVRKIALISLACFTLQSESINASTVQTTDKEVANLINVWLDFQKDYAKIPAIMGTVVQDQNVLWSGAVGLANVPSSIPASTDTLTSICSVSKVFTATAIMKLIDEGKIRLDDDVRMLLPEYAFEHSFSSEGPVTVRSLLTHTSGIPRDTEHGYWGAPDFNFPSEQAFVKSVSAMQTTQAVGTKVNYSNVGYGLLGALIEKVSGQTYKAYMESQLFQPLNMANSTVEMQSATHGNAHALGYSALNRHGQRQQVGFFQTRALQPAAGISTSINDFSRFAMWQFEQPGANKPLALMSQSHRDSMMKDQTELDQGRARGFGYEVYTDNEGNDWATHGGMCPGYNSFVKLNKTKKQAFAIFTNSNQVRALAYVNGLIDITNAAQDKGQNNQTGLELSEFGGFYDPAPWNSPYYVSSWGEGLMFMYLPADSLKYSLYRYKHIENDTFGLMQNGQLTGEQVEFKRDQSGNVTGMLNGGNLHPRVAQH